MEGLWVVAIFLSIVVAGISILVTIVNKNEKKKKVWLEDAKIGDTCSVSSINGDPTMNKVEIVDMDDDTVTIKVVIKKRWIYPPKNRKLWQ